MIDPKDMREPTQAEVAIFDALLSAPFPGREELKAALNDAVVSNIDPFGGLKIKTRLNTFANTIKPIPVEAELIDVDGVPIHILLHVKNGMPEELEIYKEDGSRLIGDIDPSRLQIIVLPPYKGTPYR